MTHNDLHNEKPEYKKYTITGKEKVLTQETTEAGFCLFGFRSGKIWKKALAVAYFIFCLTMLFCILIQKRYDALPDRDHWVNVSQNVCLLVFFFSPFIFLSRSALRRILPLLKKNRYGRDAVALLMVWVILFFAYVSINRLHTPEFLADQEHHAYVLIHTDDPSCTAIGEKRYECSFCGRETYENITALGHDYQPVENEAGQTVHQCSRCGEIQTEIS